MADDTNAPAPAESEGKSAPDVRDTMSAVYDRLMANDEPEKATVQTPESAEPEKPATIERARGPDGKFVAKSEDATAVDKPKAPTETPPAEVAKATAETEAAQPAAPEQPPEKVMLPKSWQNEQRRQLFIKAPAEVQRALAEREAEMEAGVAKLQQRFAPYEQLVAPIRQQLAMEGRSPEQYLSALMAADQMLRENPHQALGQIARMYGVSIPGVQQSEAQPQDPVSAELYQLKQELAQLKQAPQQAIAQEANSQIDRFAADPANVHFPTVRGLMASLMQNGTADTLERAYEIATQAHPDVRKQIEAEKAAQSQAAQAEAARKAAADAQRMAAVNAATRSGVGATRSPASSIRETMKRTADRIYGAA